MGVTPDTTSHFEIWDSYGICSGAGSTTTIVDSSKKWVTNIWAGKKVRLTGGTSFGLVAGLNEILIVSNTATTLTFAAITGLAPDATTTYTILGTGNRGAGNGMIHAYGFRSGRYIYMPRGGATAIIDRYDIRHNTYELAINLKPQTDTFTTGSYYTYNDTDDRIYMSPGVATGIVQHVYAYDLDTSSINGFGSVPNTQLAPVFGNRMEIVTSPAGIDYLYHMRNTGAEMYRAQIWF
jgi:hypothetical protein